MNLGTIFQPLKRGLWARVVLLIALAGPVAVVEAQETLTPEADARYRSTLKDALAEYDANHFEEARILFRRAHEINPNARTLRSIGMASFELRDYVAAVRALSAALVDTRKPLNIEQRTHAKGLLERSRMYVDIYTLKILPPDARVLIDGRVPDTEPDGTILLGFGSHTLEVSKPGFVLRTMAVNVRGGERKEISMTLERKQTAAFGSGESNLPESGRTTRSDRASSLAKVHHGQHGFWHSRAPWYYAAGGTALLSAGAGVLWLIQNGELGSCHQAPPGQRCSNESAILDRRNLAVGASVATGVAAITLAVIAIFHRDAADDAASSRSALACTLSPSGFLCAKGF
jgi:hypothetical protein